MSNAPTLKIKSDFSRQDSQLMNLSKISEALSTSREKDLLPYWNELCLEKSKRLLSLTRTGYVGSDLTWSSLSLPSSTQQSWFSTKHDYHQTKNLFETSSPLSTFSPPGFTDSANTTSRSKKIRIYPKRESGLRLRQYLGLSRYWFNKAIEHLKQPDTKASLYDVRTIQNNEHPEWAFDCPQRIREHSINEACQAVKNAKRKYGTTHRFQQVKFRSRKDPVQRFGFDKQSLNKNFVFKGSNKILFDSSESINSELEGTRIIKENGRWFLILPQRRSIKTPDNQRLGAVAIDPGVRTFVSYYSETHHGKIGEGDFNRIFRLCVNLDRMMSKMYLSRSRRRRNIRRAAERLRWKIKDLINDLHHKTANFLVRNFDIVFLPTFETQQMVSRLRHKTARMMLTFAHFRFKSFLKAKGEEYSCEVIDVSEAYTSKTCSYCGKIHNIGSKKVLRCGCGATVDRDLNGARGIYLRALMATSIPADSRNATVC